MQPTAPTAVCTFPSCVRNSAGPKKPIWTATPHIDTALQVATAGMSGADAVSAPAWEDARSTGRTVCMSLRTSVTL